MPDNQFNAIVKEIDEVRKGIERSYTAINAIFGIILPAAVTFFIFIGKDKSNLAPPVLAFIFIALVSLAFIWSQVQWMELLRYVRYYYCELMPRLYRLSNQANEKNFLEWAGKRKPYQWLPMLMLDIGCLALVGAALLVAWDGTPLVAWGALLFLLGAIASVGAVMKEVHSVQVDIRKRVLENDSFRKP